LSGWLVVLCAAAHTCGGDWPQILGPRRDGVADDEAAPERLDATPRIIWTVPTGQGYAGPAVSGAGVLLFDRVEDQERLQAIDRESGKTRWQRDFSAGYRAGIDPDIGPRCVPLIDRGMVVIYGAAGVMHAVALADGKPLWSRDVIGDFGGSDGYFGTATTPIVVGDRVLVNAGGRRGAGLVALDLRSGRTLWQSTDDAASYSSPTLLRRPDLARVVFVTRLSALLVDPADGRVVAQQRFGRSGPTVNAATPLVFDDHVFLTSNYQVGAMLLRVDGDEWHSVWANDETLSSQYNTPVYFDGFLYGIHGREDLGRAELRCVEARTGRLAWREPNFGVAHLLRVGNRLLLLKVDGTLILAEVDSQRFRPLGQMQVSRQTTRALPALSNGKLFIRENNAQGGHLTCIAL
jgi:outer membrane protein assembly factor BamB